MVHQLDGQLDQCRARFAAAPRSKPHECLEARNLLTAMQAGARHTSLDYVCLRDAWALASTHASNPARFFVRWLFGQAFQINVAQTQERAEIAEKVLAYMSANLSYFLQGYDALKDLEPYMKAQGQRVSAFLEEGDDCFSSHPIANPLPPARRSRKSGKGAGAHHGAKPRRHPTGGGWGGWWW